MPPFKHAKVYFGEPVAERILGAEMEIHLADTTERHVGNRRNGTSRKTVEPVANGSC